MGWAGEFAAAGLRVDDSKKVYNSGGPAALERTVLAAAVITGWQGADLPSLLEHLGVAMDPLPDWFDGSRIVLPLFTDSALVLPDVAGSELRLYAQLTFPQNYNEQVDATDNKSTVAMGCVAGLMRRMLADHGEEGHLLVDKQGGRNRYAPFLFDCFPGCLVATEAETAQRSCYKLGPLRVEFAEKADAHSPEVALASMTAKYLREVFMWRFNSYWCTSLPGIAPTAGYPEDGRRFVSQLLQAVPSMSSELRSLLRER
jgi:ribonuclease HII